MFRKLCQGYFEFYRSAVLGSFDSRPNCLIIMRYCVGSKDPSMAFFK